MESIEILLVFSDENSSENQQKKIWVSRFAYFLEITFVKIFKQQVEISTINIENELPKETNIILPLLDDDFVQSKKASDVIKRYAQKRNQNLENIERLEEVIIIICNHIKDGLTDYFFNGVRHLNFSELDLENYFADIQNDNKSVKYENIFWLKMYDLAFMIINKNEGHEQSLRFIDKKKTVYLAKVTPDLRDLRNDIKRDLRRHGYNVIPHTNLVNDGDNITHEIKSHLEKASLSIHLIGNAYGDIISENKSMTDLQNKVADEHGAAVNNVSANDRFYRTIWFAPAIEEMSEEINTLVTNINRDIEAKNESEFLQLPFEELKVIVRDKLKYIEDNVSPIGTLRRNGSTNIYLVFDQKDTSVSDNVRTVLESNGYDVSVPVFGGAQSELEPNHIMNLKSCDACLVLMDRVNEAWLNTKLKDIDKVYGLGRNKKMLAKGVFFFSKLPKNTHINNGTIIMKSDNNPVKEILEPFFKKIRSIK